MRILGKIAPVYTQVLQTINKGLHTVELQLLDDFLETENARIINMLDKVPELNVYSVHAPFLTDKEVEIEDVIESNLRLPFLKTCYLAESLADKYKRDITVVVHIGLNTSILTTHKDILYRILRELDTILSLFTHIRIAIENTMPISTSKGFLETKNNFLYDNIEVCEFLRDNLKSPKIYTVLDICHALSTIRFMEQTSKDTGIEPITLYDYFERSAGTVDLIHLNNVKNLGLREGEHNLPFHADNVSDRELLFDIVDCYNKFTPNTLCVLEIDEKDYDTNCTCNKIMTLETLAELGIPYKIV